MNFPALCMASTMKVYPPSPRVEGGPAIEAITNVESENDSSPSEPTREPVNLFMMLPPPTRYHRDTNPPSLRRRYMRYERYERLSMLPLVRQEAYYDSYVQYMSVSMRPPVHQEELLKVDLN
jgi:hypothetical protein